jgi:hypothetical protein
MVGDVNMKPFLNTIKYGLLVGALAAAPAFAQSSSAPTGQGSPAGGATGTSSTSGTGTGYGTTGGTDTTTAAPGTPGTAATGNGYTTNGNGYGNDDRGTSHNFGWIGLVGLAGLAGLMRGGRRVDDRTTDRTGVDTETRTNRY